MADTQLRFAYADPPYPGQAKRHYSSDPRCAEVNHAVLISTMCDTFNGWALSTSSPALQEVLPLCPPDIRIMAWVKPFHIFKRNVNPSYGWEPVIVWHPRKRPADGPKYMHGYRDFVQTDDDERSEPWTGRCEEEAVRASITLKKGMVGVKPKAFCFWLFEVLNLKPGDEFVDLFPGTHAVTDALEEWEAEKVGVGA